MRNDTFPTPFCQVPPFAEAYQGAEVHREGRGAVLRPPLGKAPLVEDAEHAQKCHPGDQADPRA